MPARALGKVSLIGAGPGDPDLITLRGLELIREADVIFYDNLATPELLVHAKPGAEAIYVGKKRARHALSQDELNRLLVEHAREGRKVARLKGGDPLTFGRGGEEAEALAAAEVDFEVVPGVSSASGAAAYAGIPLTHREYASTLAFVTGHEPDRVAWERLDGAATLVIFMGLTTFGEIAERLIAAGRPADTPAVAVRWATRPDQRTVVGTLADLASRVAEAGLKPPALVIVGQVVALREKINWFERLPLFGRRVVVTRGREQAPALGRLLRRAGAAPLELPAIEIGPPPDWGPLDAAIARLPEYDWLIFTSRNGVDRFVERLDFSGRDWRALRAKIAAIGPATAEALRALHLKVDLVPGEFVAEGVLEALSEFDLADRKVLLPRAQEARDLLPRELRRRGAVADVVPAYRTVAPSDLAERARRLFSDEERPDWVVFTSSSTARNLTEALPAGALERARVATIGPITSKTAREAGLRVDVEADPYTIEGLVEALIRAESR